MEHGHHNTLPTQFCAVCEYREWGLKKTQFRQVDAFMP